MVNAHANEASGDGPAIGQLSCSMTSALVRYIRAHVGDQAVADLIAAAVPERTATELEDVTNWIWYEEAIALLDVAAELTGDPAIARRIGEEAVRQHAGTPVATVLRSLGSPEAVYSQLAVGVTKFSTITELVPSEVAPGRAVASARSRPGFTRHQRLCDWTSGLLSQPPVLFGLPPARVEESSCEARGDDECVYTITWDAASAASGADPHQLVTQLEAQVAAMNSRLQSMYLTARDLIALDDLDSALARITERAATAVRAPKYLLAVRAGADATLSVHHRGFAGEDPIAAAHRLLDEDHAGPAADGGLVADVVSGARFYGRLMAASPAAAFFAHERDLLEVYARFAASVLDSAMAFEEARKRAAQSTALLHLAQQLAAATTSGEVSQRLADGVPAIVDCDRVVAFLWDEREQVLVHSAVSGFEGEPRRVVQELRIRPADTPQLARLIASPDAEPIFFEPTTADGFVAEAMRRTRAAGLMVVPIFAHGRFYGILNVSVTERPERLVSTAALRDLLAGVVAQAATSLDNARLIETMSLQARVDNLTGLLGHRAFHEALEVELQRAEGAFTLAAIDLDDFKLVNDLHGHPVGDEALRRVSEALRAWVRDTDCVFRVGGEEFAVLLPGVEGEDALGLAESLREAVARTPFTLPLRVSIGLASWPADAADRESLIKAADGALYAAKRRGKDRVVGASAGSSPRDGDDGTAACSLLLDALKAKDVATVVHSAHVATLAVEVGSRLGLEGERLADLRLAARLHDVGKVAVPECVISKPGPLDAAELAVMRTHPVVGAELVSSAGLPRVARFVLEHHERVDGMGYPAGLSGSEITLEARILHATDAYTAMTSDRPYRASIGRDAALAELRKHAGTQFDAEVAAALAAAVEGGRPPGETTWDVAAIAGSSPLVP